MPTQRPSGQTSSAQALPLHRQGLDYSLREEAQPDSLDLLQRVRAFVARRSGFELEKIRPESRLLQDLGIDGNDAADLLIEFSVALEIDMSGFTFYHFFHDQPTRLNKFRFWRRSDRQLKPLTVEDLYQTARLRKFTHSGS